MEGQQSGHACSSVCHPDSMRIMASIMVLARLHSALRFAGCHAGRTQRAGHHHPLKGSSCAAGGAGALAVGYAVMLGLALCKWCRRMAGQACWPAAACSAALDLLLGVAAERQTMSLCMLLCPAAACCTARPARQLLLTTLHPEGSAPWRKSPAGRAHRALGAAPLGVGGRRHPKVPAAAGGRPCRRNGELPRLRLP